MGLKVRKEMWDHQVLFVVNPPLICTFPFCVFFGFKGPSGDKGETGDTGSDGAVQYMKTWN